MLGRGTFGQVVKARSLGTGEVVAVKVIKLLAAYHQQARVEIGILQLLNTRADPDDRCNIVRLRSYFMHGKHLCLVFELLDMNLYELLKQNHYRGLSMLRTRSLLGQILTALCALRSVRIIHCDLKPENVLLRSVHGGEVKLIDYGSSCADGATTYEYIQSRFYRAPEVLLGAGYGAPIDTWSLGCLAAELFLGLPLWPGASEYNQIQRLTEALGPPPPSLLLSAKHAHKFFRSTQPGNPMAPWTLLTPDEHAQITGKPLPALGKRHFAATTLSGLIQGAPLRRGLSEPEVRQELAQRMSFLDWLQGLLRLDPDLRWTPSQAAQHPFITGEPFSGAWTPPPEAPPPPLRSSLSPVKPAFHPDSPMPSPRSAAAWPGGVFPVGSPHSLHDPSGFPSPPSSLERYAQLFERQMQQERRLVPAQGASASPHFALLMSVPAGPHSWPAVPGGFATQALHLHAQAAVQQLSVGSGHRRSSESGVSLLTAAVRRAEDERRRQGQSREGEEVTDVSPVQAQQLQQVAALATAQATAHANALALQQQGGWPR